MDDHQHEHEATKLDYFENMWTLFSQSTFLSYIQTEDKTKREAIILESTIFHPQGGGQPSDTGFITIPRSNSSFTFIVKDVRSINGIVYHYGHAENSQDIKIERGTKVELRVDESRRILNSRLHSAGHLLDVCIRNIGLEYLDAEKGKGYHFPDGPFVEYKGTIPQSDIPIKLEELERDANALITTGGRVYAAILPYEEAAGLCGGRLPDYIPKDSNPRIIKLGENIGCPCGGTHVRDISEIRSVKISQIRTKKGMTKISYQISD